MELSPIPTEIGDVKYLMGMGEQLGMNLVRLISIRRNTPKRKLNV